MLAKSTMWMLVTLPYFYILLMVRQNQIFVGDLCVRISDSPASGARSTGGAHHSEKLLCDHKDSHGWFFAADGGHDAEIDPTCQLPIARSLGFSFCDFLVQKKERPRKFARGSYKSVALSAFEFLLSVQASGFWGF